MCPTPTQWVTTMIALAVVRNTARRVRAAGIAKVRPQPVPPTPHRALGVTMKSALTDAMIDIETLDTRPSAVVLSIGVVLFNRRNADVPFKELNLKFGKREFRDEQIMMGRTISKDTAQWWRGQDPEAKSCLSRRTSHRWPRPWKNCPPSCWPRRSTC